MESSIFTIVGGTTIPDRAAIVRAECREGSRVELRTAKDREAKGLQIEVWLECGTVKSIYAPAGRGEAVVTVGRPVRRAHYTDRSLVSHCAAELQRGKGARERLNAAR